MCKDLWHRKLNGQHVPCPRGPGTAFAQSLDGGLTCGICASRCRACPGCESRRSSWARCCRGTPCRRAGSFSTWKVTHTGTGHAAGQLGLLVVEVAAAGIGLESGEDR